MYFKEIRMTNFRNYEQELVDFHSEINLITGKNAQGKTNLLEALYIMSLGKSFRTNKDSEMIGFGKDFCRVKCTFFKNDREHAIEIEISREGKKITVNGVSISKHIQLLENIYIVVFSPEDLKIVKDEPEKRRRFLDRELCQIKPVYYKTLSAYKKVLKQRNALLKNKDVKRNMLEVWDESLAKYGSKLIIERDHFIKKINITSDEIHREITNGREKLQVSYESNTGIFENERDIEVHFLDRLKEKAENDIYRQTTGCGPHKDDLKVVIDGVDIRRFGSQGQQRTAALSLKLAELAMIKEETGEDAVLLMDDVLSELDFERQRYLIKTLSNRQTFITCADLSDELKKSLHTYQLYFVDKGTVIKE